MVVQDQLRLSEAQFAWANQMTKVRMFLAWGSLGVRLSDAHILQVLGRFRSSDGNFAWANQMTKVRFLFAWRSLERTNFSEFWATTMVARLSDGSLRLSDASPGQTRNLRFHNLFLIQKPLFDPPNTQNDLLHWLWVQYTTKHQKQFITTSSATQFNTLIKLSCS